MRCFCQGQDTDSPACSSCGSRSFHSRCLKLGPGFPNYECPTCAARSMDPLHPVRQVLCEDVVKMGSPWNLEFELRPERLGPHLAVELRCFRLEFRYLYDISWPDYAELVINRKHYSEFKPLLINSSLKKRKD
jgi:hypothetical protein